MQICQILIIDWYAVHVVLLASSKQRDLYDETFRDLIQAVLDGFNGTIFAYGQTGTGKTFTMQGAATAYLDACIICVVDSLSAFNQSVENVVTKCIKHRSKHSHN